MKFVIACGVAMVLTSSLAFAELTAKLSDGRSVLLKDGGTYRILPNQDAAPGNADGPNYNSIDMPDLKIDIKQIIGQNIRVNAVATIIGDVLLLSDPAVQFDMNGIAVNIEKLPRDTRRWIVSKCSSRCRVTVEGEVIANAGMFAPGLLAHSLKER